MAITAGKEQKGFWSTGASGDRLPSRLQIRIGSREGLGERCALEGFPPTFHGWAAASTKGV
jgi:hypothetical protein